MKKDDVKEKSIREFNKRLTFVEKVIQEGLMHLRKNEDYFNSEVSAQVPYSKKNYEKICNDIEYINSIADAYNIKLSLEDTKEGYVRFSKCR